MLLSFYFQLLIPLGLMFFPIPKRERFYLRLILSLVLTVGLSLFITADLFSFFGTFWSNLVYYLFAYFFGFLVAFVSFDLPIIKLIYLVVESYIIQNFSHHIFQLIMRLMAVPAGTEYDAFRNLILLSAIYLVFYLIFFFLVDHHRIRDFQSVPVLTLLLGFTFLFVMIVFGVYVRHGRSDLLELPEIAIGYELYSVVLSGLMLGTLLSFFSIGRLRDDVGELEFRLRREERYYEQSTASLEVMKRLNHDMKHHIAALRNMDESSRNEALNEMERLVAAYGSVYKTGNSALDSLLTEKGIFCSSKGIRLTVAADGTLLNGMKYTDVYVLFGNAIDNAMESAAKAERDADKYIDLKILKKGEMTFIHLANWCSPTLQIAGELPKTTKTEEGHGFGVRSILYLVEKYDGSMIINAKNEEFTLDVLLPPLHKPQE